MVTRVFGIYDSKVEAFLPPFFGKTKSDAIRSITDLVNDPQHNFHKHAEDFTLFELATFNEDLGEIMPHESKISLGCFIEFKREV
jgi:hypothetical protein